MEKYHLPVLLDEVLDALNIRPGGEFADLTFGEGGHSGAILDRGAASVTGLDRDTEALELYRRAGARRDDSRLNLIYGRMSQFPQLSGGKLFDGILVDLGVSTRQLLRGERGFSFNQSGPLDMRMDPSNPRTLASVLDEMSAEELADALYEAAELRNSRSLARKILEAHDAGKLLTTVDLAQIAGPKFGKSNPATPLFLALRMIVNEEFREVKTGLIPLIDCLKPGGRLAVISFHSTEDRLVKKAMLFLAGRCICDEPICRCPRLKQAELILKKPLVASENELRDNPRARSAKLRCVEKVTLPA